MQCIFFLIYPTQSVIVIFFVFSRMKVPLRKLSCGTRISKFISIYWRSLIVVLTPLLLLPIILENNTPVSNAHWRTWTKTKQKQVAQKSEMIFCMLFHSNSDAYTLSYWWRYSGAVRRCHYVSAPNVSYYCWRFRCLPVKFQNRYELIFEYSYLYFQRTFSFRIAITSMLPIVLFPLLGILVSDRFERSIM